MEEDGGGGEGEIEGFLAEFEFDFVVIKQGEEEEDYWQKIAALDAVDDGGLHSIILDIYACEDEEGDDDKRGEEHKFFIYREFDAEFIVGNGDEEEDKSEDEDNPCVDGDVEPAEAAAEEALNVEV